MREYFTCEGSGMKPSQTLPANNSGRCPICGCVQKLAANGKLYRHGIGNPAHRPKLFDGILRHDAS